MLKVKKLTMFAFATYMSIATAMAADPPAVDPDLAQFRQAYTSGSGLSYVVIKNDTGRKGLSLRRRITPSRK
jgi:hypothetical protein